jgi:transposase
VNRDEAEEYTQTLGLSLSASWRQILLGDKLGVPKELGLTTREWVDQRLGGYVKLSVEERREVAAELTKEEGLTTRKAADVLGVDHSTIVRDIGANAPRQSGKAAEPIASTVPAGANAPAKEEFPELADLPDDEAERVAAELRAYPEGAERDRRREAAATWHKVHSKEASEPDLKPLDDLAKQANRLVTALRSDAVIEAASAAPAMMLDAVIGNLNEVTKASAETARALKPKMRRVK